MDFDAFYEALGAATDAVNAAPRGSHEEHLASRYRQGLLDGIKAAGFEPDLSRQDLRQLNMGHDRPMCCGVWLDKAAA